MKIRAYLSIGLVNAKREDIIEIDDEELEGLTDCEKEEIIDEYIKDWADNYIETGFKILEK